MLETSFGGGKTHNLIALYHICHGGVDPETVKACVAPELIPVHPLEKIAGVVGPDMDVAEGVDHGDVSVQPRRGSWSFRYKARRCAR